MGWLLMLGCQKDGKLNLRDWIQLGLSAFLPLHKGMGDTQQTINRDIFINQWPVNSIS
ncbi:hypothetical protein BN874_1260016 [Candidatus Contendobacter odensis Run_B_J11]|uniref:Uncharacterized protein n=1 Tax=Candidatus Contendobacter odensis Run_B_J11 TaxID=1400861 RepID=A0A7U7J2S0_9GAMM|nr:hypothetical protein BN874_1260016 [Candidatus Contendobacter odensis Run_B_J11]